jgi:acetyl-CoA C-acetyltransferase
MAAAFIVDAVRTAGGRRNGRLAGVHPVDLGAVPLSAIVARTGIDPQAIDDVIMGCVSQAGEQSNQVGRHCVLASTLPISVPAVTVDRQCGSSQQAAQFAVQAIMSGTQDVVIAAGVESMSRVKMGSPAMGENFYGEHLLPRFGVPGFSQFESAEIIARKNGFSREEVDAFALRSHANAQAAIEAGAFDAEIVPVPITLPDGTKALHVIDEGVRPDASAEALSKLAALSAEGVVTAGNASQICDGAAAVLIVSERALREHGLTPIARIAHVSVTAGDPVNLLEEPLYATQKALARTGMSINDIDLFEVNEAFAPIPLAWMRHLDADPDRLNVNGGAIALGHPLGASGAKLMTTLVNALRTRGKRYGLQTMCEGGGTANVTILELV